MASTARRFGFEGARALLAGPIVVAQPPVLASSETHGREPEEHASVASSTLYDARSSSAFTIQLFRLTPLSSADSATR